ncbi:Hypothetical_protein [Hexamita inflata]|uniref:Hypothetical_protein n=1 Tax=Hexamita inflata TaxID=28002 RepID=A0AA86Q082_9EUKA|nr:Hypothetical protein HINF_LOCUS36343 [Hexamita inflata]
MSSKLRFINIPQHLKQLNVTGTNEGRLDSVSSFLNNQSGSFQQFNKFESLLANLKERKCSLAKMNQQMLFITEFMEQVVFKNIRKISQNNYRIEDYLFQIERLTLRKGHKKNEQVEYSQ